ncbi:MAG: cation-transporting P-type ATPase, partial [Syntrophorhabdaceae bacterium]|nr:cation-transporting P-type ATPase [Syntrophorhabdaceae bacterium]
MGARWHSLEVERVIEELGSDVGNGLSEEEVKKRLEKYGYNELQKEEKLSPLALFLSQFKNLLTIILIIATILSFAVGEPVDAIFILIIVFFCA